MKAPADILSWLAAGLVRKGDVKIPQRKLVGGGKRPEDATSPPE